MTLGRIGLVGIPIRRFLLDSIGAGAGVAAAIGATQVIVTLATTIVITVRGTITATDIILRPPRLGHPTTPL